MPIYEYRCTKCAQTTELIQGINDPAASKCPECGGTLAKLFSAPSFQFKGSGWYVTDYADKGQGNKVQGSQEQGTESGEGKGDNSTDSESSAKSEKVEKKEKPKTVTTASE